MKLIIVRHGETIENKEKIFQGQSHGTLSELGIEQAKKLALRLKDEKFDAIYSSDLGRAVNTAKEILKYHPNLKLNLDKRLRETHIQGLEGMKIPENFDWDNLPKGSETRADVYKRAKEFIEEIYPKNKDKTLLLVTHGGFKMAILVFIHNLPLSEFERFSKLQNTSVSIFDIGENGNHKIHLINCIKHLEVDNDGEK